MNPQTPPLGTLLRYMISAKVTGESPCFGSKIILHIVENGGDRVSGAKRTQFRVGNRRIQPLVWILYFTIRSILFAENGVTVANSLAALRLFPMLNRDLNMYDVDFNDASFETEEFFMQNKENNFYSPENSQHCLRSTYVTQTIFTSSGRRQLTE